MKRLHVVLVAMFVIGLVVSPGADAQTMRHGGGDTGDLVILRELGIVAGPKEGTDDLEVLTLLPDAADRSEVTIERGDLLLMIGGERIRDAATFREIYDGAEIGQNLKIGFRRGDERFLVSFEKEEKPEGEMRVMMMSAPDQGELHPLMEFGVVLTEADGKVLVGMEMPTDERALSKDDVIVEVNGQAVDSIAAFRKVYEAVQIGDDLELVYTRDGEEQSLTRARAEAKGMIRMGSHP